MDIIELRGMVRHTTLYTAGTFKDNTLEIEESQENFIACHPNV